MEKIRVLVVDDSPFLLRYLPRILERTGRIQVVGTAVNGLEAVNKVKELRPDVVTLDVVMPVMDGLGALKQIMQECPTPVVMLSWRTYEGAQQTLEALSLGAVDFVTKPSGPTSLDIDKVSVELIEKIKTAYASNIHHTRNVLDTQEKFQAALEKLLQPSSTPMTPARGGKQLIALAASTGGPTALHAILPLLPATLNAGIVVAQHMVSDFTAPLAERLNSLSQITVQEAKDGMAIQPGVALIAPGESQLTVERRGADLVVRLSSEPSDTTHRPSADVLFHSIARCCAAESCAVILTGMGDDGALGMRAVRDGGGYTIAQDEATSLVYGMPRQAVLAGGVLAELPLEQIATELVRATASVRQSK